MAKAGEPCARAREPGAGGSGGARPAMACAARAKGWCPRLGESRRRSAWFSSVIAPCISGHDQTCSGDDVDGSAEHRAGCAAARDLDDVDLLRANRTADHRQPHLQRDHVRPRIEKPGMESSVPLLPVFRFEARCHPSFSQGRAMRIVLAVLRGARSGQKRQERCRSEWRTGRSRLGSRVSRSGEMPG
jgi:hypothetical protein